MRSTHVQYITGRSCIDMEMLVQVLWQATIR